MLLLTWIAPSEVLLVLLLMLLVVPPASLGSMPLSSSIFCTTAFFLEADQAVPCLHRLEAGEGKLPLFVSRTCPLASFSQLLLVARV